MNTHEALLAIYDYYQKYRPDEIEFTFFPPATREEVDVAQAELGALAPFPDDLRQLYLQHGMLMGLWDNIDVLTLEEIPTTQERLLKIAAEYGDADPIGPVSPEAHAPTRIPFAIDSDTTLSIDLAPPPGGKPGQVVRLDLELTKIEVIAGSLAEFFEQGLERLKSEQ